MIMNYDVFFSSFLVVVAAATTTAEATSVAAAAFVTNNLGPWAQKYHNRSCVQKMIIIKIFSKS